jgi:hypothetical protein
LPEAESTSSAALYDIYLSSRRRAQILCGVRAWKISPRKKGRGGIAEFTGSERRQLPSTSPAPTVRWSSKGQLVEEEKEATREESIGEEDDVVGRTLGTGLAVGRYSRRTA